MRILIADDDDVSRLELEALLTRHGHEVVAVADGTEAWEILQGDNPPRLRGVTECPLHFFLVKLPAPGKQSLFGNFHD